MFTIDIDTEHTGISLYAIMIFLSFAVGITAMYIMNVRSGVRKNIAGYLVLLSPLMSVSGAMTLTSVTTMGRAIGLSSIGGLSGMYASVLIMVLICRRREEAWAMFESCTLILPLMYSISKLGCLFAGCCRGMEYHGPCCIEYTWNGTDTIRVFPVQPAETIVFLCIFAAGMILFRAHSRRAVPVVIISSAATKILLDFMRESHTGKIISFNQLNCLLLLAIGAGVIFGIKRRRNEL